MKTLSLLLTLLATSKAEYLYETPGEECPDIWAEDSRNILDPWPERCQVYKITNECDRYEMSEDGQTILSCHVGTTCMAVYTEPECLSYYKDGALTLGAGLALGLSTLLSSQF